VTSSTASTGSPRSSPERTRRSSNSSLKSTAR
jgi:hypothetical protein